MATFASSSQAAGTDSPYTIERPSEVASGTYMVAAINNDVGNNGSGISITGGTTWQSLTSGLTGQTGYRLFWKIAGSSEPANYTVTFNDANTAYSVASIITSNDAAATAPVWQVTTTTGNGTTGPTPGITPPDATALEARFILASIESSASRSWNAPSGLQRQTNVQAGGYPSGASATRTLASASNTTSLNFTASGTLMDRVGITVGIPSGTSVQTVTPSAIASEEAFGAASLAYVISPTGIASAEAFGTPTTRLYVAPSGVASGEAFGLADMAKLIVRPVGITSGEAFGTPILAFDQLVLPSGIASHEAFGLPGMQLGYPQTLFAFGIEPGELVEDPSVRLTDCLVLGPPSVQETPAAWNALHGRYGLHRGITIMQDAGGVWRLVRYPAQTEVESAQRVYMGGRRHVLTVDEATELTSAGYGAYITLEPDT